MQQNKILILSDCNSVHTRKWVEGLLSYNYIVTIFSFYPEHDNWSKNKNIKIFSLFASNKKQSKLRYVFAIRIVNKILKSTQFDTIHAHYASSYGLVARMSHCSDYFISVWGSEIYDFPNNSFIHKNILSKNLNQAKLVFSSSKNMAKETQKYTNTRIEVIPFGIDTTKFVPNPKMRTSGTTTFGCIKSLEKIYAIDNVIKAFKLLNLPHSELIIVGGGSESDTLKKLVAQLELEQRVHFVGNVAGEEIVEHYQKLDVFINVSHTESFGVSILEASSCGIPVIVHNKGGMPETVRNEETGILIDNNQPEQIATAMNALAQEPKFREKLGKQGRRYIIEKFSFDKALKDLILCYKSENSNNKNS